MSVRKQSVADHARGACEAASREDPGLLPYGDTSALLEHENPGAACSVSCYTQAMARVTRGLTFPDGTLCRVRGRSEESLSFCIQVRQCFLKCHTNHTVFLVREYVRSLAATLRQLLPSIPMFVGAGRRRGRPRRSQQCPRLGPRLRGQARAGVPGGRSARAASRAWCRRAASR